LDIEINKHIKKTTFKNKTIMKNSIKLSALLLLLSAGIFTSTAASATEGNGKTDEVITVSALEKGRGVSVNVIKPEASKSVVTIYDNNNSVLYKDFLPAKSDVTKGYVFTGLDNGDYTMKITSDHTVVTKTIHIYDEDQKKTLFFID
jgi:hypothetical protein